MHDINDMLFFAHVVKFRSFSEAARRLDVSKSRVSKAVARLESELGVRLLHRSTRSLSSVSYTHLTLPTSDLV